MMHHACLVLAATLVLTPAAASGVSDGLCAASETRFFACQTAANKRIGLCGAASGAVQYRFGKPGKVELAYPANPAQAEDKLRLVHYKRYQVDRIEVTFSNRGNDYALFDYTEDGKQRAGVRVTTPEGKEHEIACTRPVTSSLVKLEGVLPCDPDNALSMGVCR